MSMALTKADMAESLFNELGLNKREARELVELFFEELRASLASGEQVTVALDEWAARHAQAPPRDYSGLAPT